MQKIYMGKVVCALAEKNFQLDGDLKKVKAEIIKKDEIIEKLKSISLSLLNGSVPLSESAYLNKIEGLH